jgi:adenine-specific DNA-methyltransferase
MNQDFQIGDLLKKSKAANLFRVYGEPDVELIKETNGEYRVRVHGMDVYDPVRRDIRSADMDNFSA